MIKSGIYLFYDRNDRPLYIGSGRNAYTRANHHAEWWMKHVVRTEIRHYEGWEASYRAEEAAIRELQPWFNVRGVEMPYLPPVPWVEPVPEPPAPMPAEPTAEQRLAALVVATLERFTDPDSQPGQAEIARRVTSALPRHERRNVSSKVRAVLQELCANPSSGVRRFQKGTNPVAGQPIYKFTILPEIYQQVS